MSETGEQRGGTGGAFAAAAERVGERLIFVRFSEALRATALPVFGIALISARVAAFVDPAGFGRREFIWCAAVTGLWILGCWVFAVARRPGAFASLARWDEAAGRDEMFASAWSFATHDQARDLRAGEALHIERASKALGTALATLPRDLPLTHLGWRAVLPVLLIALSIAPWGRPDTPPWEQPMNAAMLDEAVEKAAEVADATEALDSVTGLEPEEKEELDALREAVESAAEELATAGDRTAEEILDALEARAREAEDLADQLGEADGAWASDGLLAALGEHADTADLADAIRDKDAGASAEESEAVATKLRDPDLTAEVRDRFDTTLGRAAASADEADSRRPVGKHVGAASEALEKRAAPAAGAEFAELAKHFKTLEDREKTREALDALADALRQAGSDIAGQGAGGMEKLAGDPGGDNAANPGAMSEGLERLENPGALSDLQSMPMSAPGMQGGDPSQGQKMSLGNGAPGPGEPGDGEGMALVPGEGSGEPQGMALLPAPVPGTAPGGVVMAAPAPGSGAPAASIAMPGGLEAGSGTSALGSSESQPTAATQQGTVAAQVNADGESVTRAVDGSPHQELATRSRREVAIDFLSVQEDALDEQPLPPSRREQVKRYFRALRESFEGQP